MKMIITFVLLWSWSVRSGFSFLGWVGHRYRLHRLVVIFKFMSFLIFIFKAIILSVCFCWVNYFDLFIRNRVAIWCRSGLLTFAKCVVMDADEDGIGVERDTSADYADHKFSINKCFWSTSLRVQDYCLKLTFGHKKICRKRQDGWWGNSIHSQFDPIDSGSLDTTQHVCIFLTAIGSESVASRHNWVNWCTICTSQFICSDFGRVMGIIRHRVTAPPWAVF